MIRTFEPSPLQNRRKDLLVEVKSAATIIAIVTTTKLTWQLLLELMFSENQRGVVL